MTFRIGIVVGEPSGDLLASKLISAIQTKIPDCQVEGIAGEHLIQAGCIQLWPMHELSVMGFWEPLKRLPRILSIRKQIFEYFVNNPPDVFIGVDAPDFNLPLELKLHKVGITTVHFVSPSVWAWRAGRLKTMQQSLNLMLALFPFEKQIYHDANIPVVYTGHPTADDVAPYIDKNANKEQLRLQQEDVVVAILPGSRDLELERMAPIYLQTMQLIHQTNQSIKFVMPLIHEVHKEYILMLKQEICPTIPLTIVVSNSSLAMRAADYAICTSGTATLEMMLHKVPMLVAYKVNWFTYLLMKCLLKIKYIALPNLIAGKEIVAEYLQSRASPAILANGLLELIANKEQHDGMQHHFTELYTELRQDAANTAATAVIQVSGYYDA